MDEARVGQKGRTGFRWGIRGERRRGLCDRRFDWAYESGGQGFESSPVRQSFQELS